MYTTYNRISSGQSQGTQEISAKDALPVLPRHLRHKSSGKSKRIHRMIPPLREEEEDRPETPIVRTRHERYLLSLDGKRGSGRPIVPRDTHDIYASNGMYMRKLQNTPQPSRKTLRSGGRCPTPVPFEQPLTKLCWDNGGLKGTDTDEEDFMQTGVRVPYTPRHQVTNPLLRSFRNKNDLTVSDIDGDNEIEHVEQLHLTEHVLHSFFRKKLDSTQRIVKWLADCEEKSNSSKLPAHLPDITYRTVHVSHD